MRAMVWTLVIGTALAGAAPAQDTGRTLLDEVDDCGEREFTDSFLVSRRELSTTGRNPFFILEPGYFLILEGEEDGELVRLTIRVLNQTRTVDGYGTRVVEEKEEKGGELVEISRNYFAISRKTNSVFYFGEEVDIYEDGEIVSHDGAWLHGKDGARFGLMMPGLPLLGARYMQEIAPDVAMDRAEIVDLDETMRTRAGTFRNVLKTKETTPLEPGVGFKYYAPGIGLIKDSSVKLVRYGYR